MCDSSTRTLEDNKCHRRHDPPSMFHNQQRPTSFLSFWQVFWVTAQIHRGSLTSFIHVLPWLLSLFLLVLWHIFYQSFYFSLIDPDQLFFLNNVLVSISISCCTIVSSYFCFILWLMLLICGCFLCFYCWIFEWGVYLFATCVYFERFRGNFGRFAPPWKRFLPFEWILSWYQPHPDVSAPSWFI